MKSYWKRRREQKGFALIEVLIATFILGTAGVAFLLGLTTGILGSQRVSQKRAALDVAQSQMEYVKEQEFNTVPTQDPDLVWRIHYGTLAVGDLPDGFNQTDITVEVKKTDGTTDADGTESVQLINVTVQFDGGTRTVELSGYKADTTYI